jgi:hypothetical protein
VGVEHRLKAPTFGSTRDPAQPGVEIPCPASEDHASGREPQDRRNEADDECAEMGLDERVEVDPWVLRRADRV